MTQETRVAALHRALHGTPVIIEEHLDARIGGASAWTAKVGGVIYGGRSRQELLDTVEESLVEEAARRLRGLFSDPSSVFLSGKETRG